MPKSGSHVTPSEELLKEVRIELVRRGSSLNAFCRRHGMLRQTVTNALSGKYKGKRATFTVHRFIALLEEGH